MNALQPCRPLQSRLGHLPLRTPLPTFIGDSPRGLGLRGSRHIQYTTWPAPNVGHTVATCSNCHHIAKVSPPISGTEAWELPFHGGLQNSRMVQGPGAALSQALFGVTEGSPWPKSHLWIRRRYIGSSGFLSDEITDHDSWILWDLWAVRTLGWNHCLKPSCQPQFIVANMNVIWPSDLWPGYFFVALISGFQWFLSKLTCTFFAMWCFSTNQQGRVAYNSMSARQWQTFILASFGSNEYMAKAQQLWMGHVEAE